MTLWVVKTKITLPCFSRINRHSACNKLRCYRCHLRKIWLLAGISEAKLLEDHWIFKGGTCLNKCYFESYRFSEDLDFTITNIDHRNLEYLKTVFVGIADWIYEQIGLEFPENEITFELYNNPRGALSV